MEMIRISNDKYNCNCSEEKNPTERRATTRKKQVRRRIHRSKPYQQRLLNMAEARKEIVAALKFHRSSMRKRQEEEVETDRIHRNSSVQSPDLSFRRNYLTSALDFTEVDSPELQEAPKYVGAERRALDEEEMEEIRSIGKKHQMEWDDTFNLLTYACWFSLLPSIEDDPTLYFHLNLE